MKPSLSTTVASIPLKTCIYNASGPRTTSSAALSKIASSRSGAILAKSATLVSQSGNPLPRTCHLPNASLNSEGLPNAGIDYYIDSKTIQESIGETQTPYMVSISGKTLEDNLTMMKQIVEANTKNESVMIAAVELNLACPNVIGKPIIGYDFDQMEDVLSRFSKLDLGGIPLGIKMPPYFDFKHFEQAAKIINAYKHMVKFVSCINTIGNAFAVDIESEAPVISSNSGFAGLSGKAVKYTALANVKKMRELLDPSVDVVGVGGVETGQDAFEMILCGASAVQVGTCHWIEGPKCFDRICDELEKIMKGKGYQSVEDFKGKLKEWSKEGVAKSRAAKKEKETKDKDKENGGRVKRGGQDTGDVFMYLCAFLMVVIAVLLADKFGFVSF